jgi:hypothetical protein
MFVAFAHHKQAAVIFDLATYLSSGNASKPLFEYSIVRIRLANRIGISPFTVGYERVMFNFPSIDHRGGAFED